MKKLTVNAGRTQVKCPNCGNEDGSMLGIENRPVDYKIHCEVCSKDFTIDRDHE